MSVYAPDFPLPYGFLWQYELLRWMQSMVTPELNRVMHWLSMLGVESAYILVLPVLFWSINKKIGLRITYVLLTSMYTNAWLKEFIGIIRPVGVPGIRSMYTESATTLYSMPSGHAQGPMTFLWTVGKWVKRRWLWPILFLVVFLIGISRLFLGLHWPVDVLLGWALGLVFGLFGWGIGRWWTYRAYGFNIRMVFAIGLPLVLLIVHRGSLAAEYAALLLSIGTGAVLEGRYLGVDMDPTWWKRICTAVIGIAGVIALQWVIKWPPGSTVWAVLRDLLVGFWCTLGAPYVFEKCGLFQKGDRVE